MKNLKLNYHTLVKNKIVHFVGEIYDELKICNYIKNASLFVSPGNIGLACIHSLSYGTPVCTHDKMSYQMPEAEALNNLNSVLFKRNNLSSLISSIQKGIKLSSNEETKINCVKSISTNYTPEKQKNKIIEYIKSLK